jgi:hypothetical protein
MADVESKLRGHVRAVIEDVHRVRDMHLSNTRIIIEKSTEAIVKSDERIRITVETVNRSRDILRHWRRRSIKQHLVRLGLCVVPDGLG